MKPSLLPLSLAIALTTASAALADVSPAAKAGNGVLLRNFALAQCIRLAFEDAAVQKDAAAAAGAYVEFGSSGPEVYEAIVDLAKAWLARSYASQSGASLQVM